MSPEIEFWQRVACVDRARKGDKKPGGAGMRNRTGQLERSGRFEDAGQER